ncbi:MAG TPA: hypothetical protein VJ440_00460 [Candidatus Brocadiaceae bacterium]|nr:hypothetical protein [Candidatus Brocadiaceae bacterium]
MKYTTDFVDQCPAFFSENSNFEGQITMKTPEDIYPDFTEWPMRWMGVKKDVIYGKEILQIMRPFIEHLIASGLSVKTIKRHMNNLWVLGGEIIRDVNTYNEYDKISPLEKIKASVGAEGGPYCRHLEGESDIKSFDSTCRKFHKYLVAYSQAAETHCRALGFRMVESPRLKPSVGEVVETV